MQKLVADMTELKVGVVKLYLSSVIDLCNNEVVAYSIPRSLDMAMIKEMLCRLEESRGGPPPSYIESESTPIPLTPFTPPSGGLRLWASWPLRTRRG